MFAPLGTQNSRPDLLQSREDECHRLEARKPLHTYILSARAIATGSAKRGGTKMSFGILRRIVLPVVRSDLGHGTVYLHIVRSITLGNLTNSLSLTRCPASPPIAHNSVSALFILRSAAIGATISVNIATASADPGG